MYQYIITKGENILKNRIRNYWICYTAIFLILICFIFGSFYIYGKSFIWKVDGINQHYPALFYLGQYLREFVKNCLQGSFKLPLWDLKIGLGSDILTTLNYYSFGDPLDLIAVFFRPDKIENCYNILVILRIYLAGIMFSKYCFQMGKNRYQTLIGCIIYIFCGYTMVAVRHPFFINAMIYLPMTLMGVERVFNKQKSGLFIISIAISAVSNFYFLYMITILAVLYAIVKYLYDIREKTISNFFKLLSRFLSRFLLAMGLSAIIFLPILLAFFNNPRGAESGSSNLLFYNSNYYLSLIPDLLKVGSYGYWTETGISAVALICIIVLFTTRNRKYKKLKFSFVAMTIFLVVPAFGLAFNGFSYISNRWVFGYTFLLSIIAVDMVPILLKLDESRKKVIQFCSILLGVYLILFSYTRTTENMKSYIVFIFIMTGICLLKGNIICKKIILFSLTGISVVSMSSGYYSLRGGRELNQFMDSNETYKHIITSPQAKVFELKDPSIYRIQDKEMKSGNFGLVSNANTTTNFFSLTGENLSLYSNNLANSEMGAAFQITGFGNRASILSLAAVKYIVLDENTPDIEVPYGFQKLRKYSASKKFGGKTKGAIYKNQYSLPIGNVYQNVFSSEDYERLDYGYREQVQTGAAILNEKVSGIPKYTVTKNQRNLLKRHKILEQLGQNKNIQYKNGKLYVTKADTIGEVRITMERETYLQITGLEFKSHNYLKESLTKRKDSNKVKKSVNKHKVRSWEPSTEAVLGFYIPDGDHWIRYRTKRDRYYFGQSDFLLNLGNKSKKESVNLKIKFKKAGIYSIEDIKIFCKDTKQYEENMSLLQKNEMKKIRISTNRISGIAELDNKGVLCLV